MENLEITEALMAEHGLANFGPEFAVSCENHGGPGLGAVSQWNASAVTWEQISEYSASDKSIIAPLIEEDSMAFAAENKIEPRCN